MGFVCSQTLICYPIKIFWIRIKRLYNLYIHRFDIPIRIWSDWNVLCCFFFDPNFIEISGNLRCICFVKFHRLNIWMSIWMQWHFNIWHSAAQCTALIIDYNQLVKWLLNSFHPIAFHLNTAHAFQINWKFNLINFQVSDEVNWPDYSCTLYTLYISYCHIMRKILLPNGTKLDVLKTMDAMFH